MYRLRARDHGLTVGELPTGPRNKLTDVPGVTVGHCTVDTPEHKTGVTVVLPCPENPFVHKLPAAAFVLNGFGKTAGLVQVEELGTLCLLYTSGSPFGNTAQRRTYSPPYAAAGCGISTAACLRTSSGGQLPVPPALNTLIPTLPFLNS